MMDVMIMIWNKRWKLMIDTLIIVCTNKDATCVVREVT